MGKREPADVKTEVSGRGKKKSLLAVRIAGWSAAVLLLLYFALKSFLATQYAAGLASGYLGEVLRQRVAVTAISLSGMTLSVRGVTLANPGGFDGGPLATARLLRVRPDVTGLMAGKRSFSLVQAEGLSVALAKNSAGEWNFGSLIRLLSRKKKRPAAELYIGRLDLKDASLNAAGLSLRKISLTLHDLSTKGMTESKLVLTGADGKGNPFRLAAEGRLGRNPDLRLSLVAPEISLAALGTIPGARPMLSLGNATASLFISSTYRSGDLAVNGHVACNRLVMIVRNRETPLRGVVDFAARYGAARDQADLDRFSLIVNDAVRVNASGVALSVKGEKNFRINASSNDIPLKDVLSVLPRETIGETAVNGSVACSGLRLAGNVKEGITSAVGRFLLRNGEVSRSGRLLFRGMNSDIDVARTASGWNVGGVLAMKTGAGKVPLENLDARFTSRFSGSFKLQWVEIPVLKAEVRGVPVHGQLTYEPGKADPYRCMLTAKNAPLSPFNDLIGAKNFTVSTGTADVSLQAAGRGPASFSGMMKVRLSRVSGTVSGKNVALGNGDITSRFSRSGGRSAASGTAVIDGGTYSGNSFSGSCSYSLSDGVFSLSGGRMVVNRSKVMFADISGMIPMRETTPSGTRYPLRLKARNLDLDAGKTRIGSLSCSMRGYLYTGSGGRRLEGNAELGIQAFSWRSRTIGAGQARVALAGERAEAKVTGTALGGALISDVAFDPFSVAKGVSFKGTLREVRAAELSGILPEMFPLRLPSGKLNGNLQGSWSAAGGLRLGVDASGNDLALVAKGGKPLITGAGLDFRADFTGTDITVNEATVRKGEGVALKISGSVTNAASPARKGKFSLDLEKGAVNSMMSALSDLLPKQLQQANGGGRVGMGGILGVDGRDILLDGAIQFDKVLIDFPSQKVTVTDVDGRLPFSLYLSGGTVEKPVETMSFSRENYPVLLDTLRRETRNGKKGVLLKIGKVQFGPLEAGNIRVYAKAGNGLVEVSSIESTLYGGTVVGKGFMFYHAGLGYGTDLLINDMSLREFCSSYPALKGYISGKLDGVVSLYGGKGGIPAMVGFTDLWAHKGKGEGMLVSKEFLQKLAGRKLKGFFFRDDRPYDNGEISAFLLNGNITFEKLNLSHTNFFGMKDLSVSVAPVQNRIGLSHLFQTIREAAKRGKPAAGAPSVEVPVQPDVNWLQ